VGQDFHVIVNAVGDAISITVHAEIKLVLLIQGLDNEVSLCQKRWGWVGSVCHHALDVYETKNGVPDSQEHAAFTDFTGHRISSRTTLPLDRQ
jgi:hypothetical protein